MIDSRPQPFAERAAAIAHELNNLLTVVRTYAHFARQPTSGEQTARDLRVIAAAAERGTALTDWLVSTAESTPRAEDAVSSDQFTSSLVGRLQDLIAPGITVEARHGAKDLPFRANALRLEHVVLSLILAASQGFVQANFVLRAERRILAAGEHPPLAAGEYTVLVIACRAVNPTSGKTAQVSAIEQVSALLSPLVDLVATMNGSLLIGDPRDCDGRFELLLPALHNLTTRMPPASRSSIPTRTRTVCVIEDEAAIRLAMRRALTSAGHFVIEASDGVTARALLKVHADAVHLLITDVVLPRGGDDFLNWAKAACPTAALILVSGRAREGADEAVRLGARFLAKPFTPRELMAVVRQTLLEAGDSDRPLLSKARRPLVLIVDDEESLLSSYQRLLAERDFDTVVARSAALALPILKEDRVHAIVSDQFMPGMDGIELLEFVQQAFPRCIRVLCTADTNSARVVGAIAQGCVQHVVPKTMHAVALRDEIARAVLEGLEQP